MSKIDLHKDVLEVLTRRFDIKELIGQGTFGKVYLAIHRSNKRKVAIKYLKPTCKVIFTQTEIQLLNECRSNRNIIDILDIIRIKQHILIVMPYFKHTPISNFMDSMSIQEIATYTYNLLYAVNGVHDKNIIHRDIKPSNFLYNRTKATFVLVDFGLAHKTMQSSGEICLESNEDCTQSNITGKPKHFSVNSKNDTTSSTDKVCACFANKVICETCLKRPNEKAKRSGTAGYRAPEILMKCNFQTRAIDVWSIGSILLSILSGCKPYFKPADDIYVLAELINIFGSERMVEAAASIGKELVTELRLSTNLRTLCESIRFEKQIETIKMLPDSNSKVSQDGEKNIPEEVPDSILNHMYSLLDSLLDPDYNKRITSEDALNHPFFTYFK